MALKVSIEKRPRYNNKRLHVQLMHLEMVFVIASNLSCILCNLVSTKEVILCVVSVLDLKK